MSISAGFSTGILVLGMDSPVLLYWERAVLYCCSAARHWECWAYKSLSIAKTGFLIIDILKSDWE